MREPVKRALTYSALGLWVIMVALGLSYLTTGHIIFFASPEEHIDSSLRALQRDIGARNSWFAIHVIADGSPCSTQVLDHLLARGPSQDRRELIVVMGKDRPETLRASSYKTMLSDQGTLARDYGVEATPLLLVMSPEEKLLYKGGYSQAKGGPISEDSIIAAAMRGESPEPLPVFDCAVSPP